jgi:hypothetical protein
VDGSNRNRRSRTTMTRAPQHRSKIETNAHNDEADETTDSNEGRGEKSAVTPPRRLRRCLAKRETHGEHRLFNTI